MSPSFTVLPFEDDLEEVTKCCKRDQSRVTPMFVSYQKEDQFGALAWAGTNQVLC